jgi:hypothetical protein
MAHCVITVEVFDLTEADALYTEIEELVEHRYAFLSMRREEDDGAACVAQREGESRDPR